MRTEERDPAAADTVDDTTSERERIKRGLIYCAWVFVGLRVGLSALGLAGIGLLEHLDPVGVAGWAARPTVEGWHNLVTMWERFDALWFLRIASFGYLLPDGSPVIGAAAFYPGYPMAIRLFTPLVGGHPLAAGFLVSHLATFGSMVLLYFLTSSEFDERIARRTVLYLAVFPTSFFLLAPYSESLFLFLVLLSLWAARRRRWELAGVAGIGVSATRNLGVLIALPLAAEAIHQFVERREVRSLVRGLVWSSVTVLGTAAYLLFWREVTGDLFAPVTQQQNWEREAMWPHATFLLATREAFRYPGVYPGGYHLVDWLIVTPALVAAGWVALRTRPLYGVYTVGSLLAPLSFAFLARPFMSVPRFLLPLFPLLWAGAVWGARREGLHATLVACSAALLGVLTILFVGWYYVF